MRRVAASGVVLLALVAGSASAEDWNNRPENDLSVAQVSQLGWTGIFIVGKPPCVPDPERIFRSAKFVLTTAHVPLLKDDEYMKMRPFPPTLSVEGDTLKMSNGGCAIHFEVRIRDSLTGDAIVRSSGQRYGPIKSIDLWSSGYIGVDSPGKLTASVASMVEEALKQFIIDRADDQKKLDSLPAADKAFLFQPLQQ